MMELDSQPDSRRECSSWKSTIRCLARADPGSSDLVAIGKEQTKHVLLSRFKKDGVLPTKCVLTDGSFTRERFGSNLSAQPKAADGTNSVVLKRRGSHVNQQARTLSDAIFTQHNLVNASKIIISESENGPDGILPCGLGWRTALRRGIALSQSPSNNLSNDSPDRRYLTRSRELGVKKKLEKKSNGSKVTTTTVKPPRPDSSEAPGPQVNVKTSRVVKPVVDRSCHKTEEDESAAGVKTLIFMKSAQPNQLDNLSEKDNSSAKDNAAKDNHFVKSKLPSKLPVKNNHVANKTLSVKDKLPANDKLSAKGKVPANGTVAAKDNLPAKEPTSQKNIAQVDVTPEKVVEKERVTKKMNENKVKSKEKVNNDNAEVAESQPKQKRRNDSKQPKKDRATSKTESKEAAKAEEIPSKTSKAKPLEKTAAPNFATEQKSSNAGANSGKKEGKSRNKSALSPPSREAVNVPHQAKPSRQTKKSKEMAKSAEGSQPTHGRSKAKPCVPPGLSISHEPLKSPEPKLTTKQLEQPVRASEAPSNDFPPLSSAPQSPRKEVTSEGAKSFTAPTPAPTPRNQKATFRPPPGLLPPPGFSNEGNNTPTILSPQNSSSEQSSPIKISLTGDSIPGMELSESSLFLAQRPDLNLSPPPMQDLLSIMRMEEDTLFRSSPNDEPYNNNSNQNSPTRSASDSSMLVSNRRPPSITPPILESMSTEAPDDVQALLGANSDFNVTNFLDGLLGDSVHSQPASDKTQEPPPLTTEPLLQFNASAIPLDPWNASSDSNRNNPLAAIIGRISDVDNNGLQGDEDNHETLIAGIPLSSNAPSLLTPSAFQSAGAYAEPAYASLINEREDEDETDSFMEPDSFYSQLLGED